MTCKHCAHEARQLSRRKAADYIGYKFKTLEYWAHKKTKLKYHKIGGRVYYNISDLDEFLKSQQTF
jgi:hypothetical protein